MDRETFDKLNYKQQVIEFNKLYEIHKSIRKTCGEIGIGKTTVRDRFKTINYSFLEGVGYVKDTNNQLEGQTSLIEAVIENKPHSEPNILELEQLVSKIVDEKLNKILETKKQSEFELSSRCEGDVKYRSLGVYKEILEEFVEYCKNKRYSQIELLSQAMLDIMEKFK